AASSQTKQLKEDIEQMMNAKGQTCAQIFEKQRRISSLESDSSTLTQTLELIHQERDTLSAKFIEKRIVFTVNKSCYVTDLYIFCFHIISTLSSHGISISGKSTIDNHLIIDNQVGNFSLEFLEELQPSNSLKYQRNEARKNLKAKLDTAKAKLDSITQMKSELNRADSFDSETTLSDPRWLPPPYYPKQSKKPSLTLEDERRAFESDKAGKTEYLHSLHNQIEKLK
ncbi:LOW QUALITY PROTEIN: hypothetical protein CFOL_v3_19686, partial [Cephalotus follicularis]